MFFLFRLPILDVHGCSLAVSFPSLTTAAVYQYQNLARASLKRRLSRYHVTTQCNRKLMFTFTESLAIRECGARYLE